MSAAEGLPPPALSSHAEARMRQRGIRSHLLACVLDFGSVMHDHRGGRIVYLDRRGCRRAVKAGAARRPEAESWRGAYAVLGTDGDVTTVGWRWKRLRRP